MLIKVHSDEAYDFYYQCAMGDQTALYNIVPKNSLVPEGGYRDIGYIEHIKHAKFPEKYQKDVPHRYR